jgi:hypothetical protein
MARPATWLLDYKNDVISINQTFANAIGMSVPGQHQSSCIWRPLPSGPAARERVQAELQILSCLR